MTDPGAAQPGALPGARTISLLLTMLWTGLVLFQASRSEPDQALLWALVGLTSTGSVAAAALADRGRRPPTRYNTDGTPRIDGGGS